MERPRLANPLERIVLAAQAVSPTLRLVGGSGLWLLLGHRQSDDVDLFAGHREDIEPVVRAIEAEVVSFGMAAKRVRTGPGFARLEIAQGAETLRVDVASDASKRLVEEDTYVGPIRVEGLRDQRANKIVALLGRSELRDLVDLYFIEQAGLPIAEGFPDALVKDAGMDPAWFAWALDQIEIQPLRGMIRPLPLEELRAFRDRLARRSIEAAGGLG